MSSNKPFTLALIVNGKNEQLVAEYVKKHLDEFSLFKLLVTKTEQNLIKKLFSEQDPPLDNVNLISSLDNSGDADLENRIVHNQLSAVFVMNYPALMRQLSTDRMAVLCEKASNSDTFMCFTPSNIDLVFTNLVNMKGVKEGGRQNPVRINQVMQNVLLTRYPSFDLAEIDRSKVSKWAAQQFCYWLDTEELAFLKPLVDLEKFTSFTTKETKYFSLDDDYTNLVKLKSAPLHASLDLLSIPPESSLCMIFNYPTYERDFLISHSVFTTSVDLMKALIARYSAGPPTYLCGRPQESHSKTSAIVINVMRDWILMEYGQDFAGNDDLLKVFEDFISNILSKDDLEAAKELKELLDIALALKPPYPVDLSKAPRPILGKKMKPGKIDLLTLSPVEVARQMTVLDELLFHKVRAKEFLGGAWTKDASKAPNLTRILNQANRTTFWVITEILKCSSTTRTVEMITKFIQIGRELMELKNYLGVLNVLNALHSAPVGKLKSAWALIGREKKELEELTEAVSFSKNFENCRAALNSLPAQTACIPLLPVTCSDLKELGEVPESTTDGWINWDKLQKVAQHIWSVRRFMRARYILKPVEEIQSFISSGDAWEGDKALLAIANLRDQFGSASPMTESNKRSTKSSDDNTKDYKMSERDWDQFSSTAEMKIYGVGEAIIPRGTLNRHLYRIKKGAVKIEQVFNGQSIIHRLMENEIFGEMTLFFPVPIIDEATVADEVTEIVKYKLDAVIDKCRGEPALSEKIHRLIARQLSLRLSTFGQKKKEDKKSFPVTPAGFKKPKVTSLTPADAQPEAKKTAKMEKKTSGRLSGSSGGKKKKTADDEFRKLFPVGGGAAEPLLKAMSCSMKAANAGSNKGTMYLTASFVFFCADVFGRKIKEKYPLATFREIKLEEGGRIIIELPSTNTIVFKQFENAHEAYSIIGKLIEQKKLHSDNTESQQLHEDDHQKTEEGEDNGLGLSEEEWNRIMEGTRSLHFKKDQPVITQGQEQPQRLYQIANGSCRIEKIMSTPQEGGNMAASSTPVVFAIMKDTDASIFGEISFLEGPGGRATASVVANERNTTIRVIEGYYLNILFEYFPGLSGRFNHYLGSVIAKRLRQREASMLKKEVEEEESEMDGDEDKSEASENSQQIPNGTAQDPKPKKNLVKRTQDLDKKTKKKRKSANRIVVHKEEDLLKEKDKEEEKKD